MSKKAAQQKRTERAAAELEAERKRNRNRQLLSVAGVVTVLLVVVGTLYFVQRGADPTGDPSAAPPANASDYGLGIGDPAAPHSVVVYEDFLCPFCAQFEAASRDDLDRLAEAGDVYVEYRPLNFLGRISDYPERAFNAFAAVLDQEGPEAAKAYHDALFENQPSESGPFPDDDALVDLAVENGADEATIRPAIEDLAFETFVADATEEASQAGVRGTPTILLDGEQFQDGSTVEELAANLVERVEAG